MPGAGDPAGGTGLAAGTPGLRNGGTFRVEVRFLSDWIMGTGTGRHGAVDHQVRRDADGFPMLSGKALVGVLRDAAETVAAGLDEGGSGHWHDWVEAVFGTQHPAGTGRAPGGARPGALPTPSALVARPLRIAAPVRAAILAHPDRRLITNAMVRLQPGVRIDSQRGTAADEMFRIDERASAGLRVVADWSLMFATVDPGEPVPWEAELLFLAATQLVDAVGGKRRRGAGRCVVTAEVPHGDARSRLDELLGRVDEAGPPPAASRPEPAGPIVARPDGDLIARHELRITALTPLVIARGVAGNLVHSESFIPGSMLLPTVARGLGRTATSVITSGQVAVTDATLEIDGSRSVPVPRALHGVKGESTTTALVNLLRQGDAGHPRLRPKRGFCVVRDSGLVIDEPPLVEHVHAVVHDDQQRPNEESGGLFVYEAIAAGTVLRAELWLGPKVTFTPDAVAGERGIGRSRSSDYGRIHIEVLPPAGARLADALDAGEAGSTFAAGDSERAGGERAELVVWLLSDVLLRGAAGQPVAGVDDLRKELECRLGVGLTLPAPAEGSVSALVTARRVESWQSSWSLPRPSLTGLAAGSVVRFQATGQPTVTDLRRVESGGVGLRTAEGFGRVALQPAVLTRPSVTVHAGPATAQAGSGTGGVSETSGTGRAGPQDDTGLSCSADEQQLLTDVLVRGWRGELRRQTVIQARDPLVREALVPAQVSAAQLGTLRTLADRLSCDGDPAAALAWISGTRAVSRRREAWNSGGQDRLGRLERILGGDVELWTLLDARPPADVAERLRLEATAMLLAEVARTATTTRYAPVAAGGSGQVEGQA